MRKLVVVWFALAVVLAMVLPATAATNNPPATPTISEPEEEGQIVHPGDVHMVTSDFFDSDSGDTHVCTDWEIRISSTSELVWTAPCSAQLVHVHLGDSSFVNSYSGRTELEYDTDYLLKARHEDSSGDPATEWSGWGTRLFRTSSPPPPGTATQWTVKQGGFRVEKFATGLKLPLNIAFIPDAGIEPSSPYFYVTELYGNIEVVSRDGTVSDYATNLLNYQPSGQFPGSGEQGLTGITVDPRSGDVFAAMLYEATPNGPHFAKVVRFHSDHGGSVADGQTTVLDMSGDPQPGAHQASNVTIGPDGKLYVHMGDGFEPSAAQNLSSYRGKILRLNLDGSAPANNPFYDSADGITAKDFVFAYGFRNPFGGDWRAADGKHYEVENGENIDRFAQVVQGRNYLWDGTNASTVNFALYNWTPAVAPVNLAFVQSQTFGGSGFPDWKIGDAYVTESGPTWAAGPQARGKKITEFVLDPNGNRLGGPTQLVTYTGTGRATVAGLAAGPDGLYFTDLYKDTGTAPIDPGADVFRVSWVGKNRLRNSDFEVDANGDKRPDAWTSNPKFTRRSANVLSGGFGGRHRATDNSGYTIQQTIGNLAAGNTYRFSGWVNIPPTTDAFTFKLQVRWRNRSNSTISTHTVKKYTGPTAGWDRASATLVAPAGTTNAQVRMVAANLKATINVDQFVLTK